MKTPTIQATTNYERFKLFASNREVDRKHLLRLMESIRNKNLLYLFPIVVNRDKEIVDGQHRLQAAKELKVPVYFIIDNNVTKADIAMVNNNRKGWVAKDYIKFYVQEGYEAYERLDKLLKNYPLTIIGAVKLMRSGPTSYTRGGGHESTKVKSGQITCEEYHTAKTICEILKPLREHVKYCYRPDFTLDLKRLFVKHKLKAEEVQRRLMGGKHLFPDESFHNDPTTTRVLKQLLDPEQKGHSAEEVDLILSNYKNNQVEEL
jgi:disulfide oxidoreductase YuzD